MSLLVDKYKPKTLDDLLGNKSNIQKAISWMENFRAGIEGTPRALFISGKPGLGKSSLAKLLLEHFNYLVVEFNSSDIRNQKLVREKLDNIMGKVTISSMMGGNKFCGIIMDEVDGMSTGDKGGLSELISFINPNKGKRKKDKKKLVYQNPIICISNTDKDKKIQDLKKEAECLKFLSPKLTEMTEFAQKIVKLEKIKIGEEKLLDIVTHSQRDIRKLLGNIQYLIIGNQKKLKKFSLFNSKGYDEDQTVEKKIKENSGLDKKVEDTNLFQSVFEIMDSSLPLEEIIRISQTDRNLINLLVHENILPILKNYKLGEIDKIKLLEEIYNYMGESDVLESYLFHNYHHSLSEINSILRCGSTSFLLNQQPKNKHPSFGLPDVTFSKQMSKFSVQHQNYNHNMNLNQKMHLKNNFRRNYLVYQIIIQKIIRSVNSKKLDPTLTHYIKKYELTIENLEKINKLLKTNMKGTKREKEFYLEATTEVDKKYFTKFYKQFSL